MDEERSMKEERRTELRLERRDWIDRAETREERLD